MVMFSFSVYCRNWVYYEKGKTKVWIYFVKTNIIGVELNSGERANYRCSNKHLICSTILSIVYSVNPIEFNGSYSQKCFKMAP